MFVQFARRRSGVVRFRKGGLRLGGNRRNQGGMRNNLQ